MTNISYAQNYEDIMLWRALKHIDNGFYIDIGANDPITDSVTKLFYDNGWNGINIDPVEKYIKKYLELRPRDLNIEKAISSEKGVMQLWQCEMAGWSTLDKDVAAKHEAEGYVGNWSEVSIDTLSAIFNEQAVGDIHFLKVDVEGAEYSVLKGNDWNKYRPWVVLIEATIPNTQVSDYGECERLLVANKYHHVYSDGLNRYYVANEHDELDSAFSYPPNVFDDFISSREADLQIKLDDHYQRMIAAINDAGALIEKNQQGNHVISELKNESENLHGENEKLESENSRLKKLLIDFENDAEKRNIDFLNGEEKKQKSISRQKNKLLQKLNATLLEVENLQITIKQLNEKIVELNHNSHFWWENAQRFEVELNNIYSSRTWKYGSLPRRGIIRTRRGAYSLKSKVISIIQTIKQRTRSFLKDMVLKLSQNIFLRRFALKVLNKFPLLKSYLRKKVVKTVSNANHLEVLQSQNNIRTNQIKNVIKNKLRNR